MHIENANQLSNNAVNNLLAQEGIRKVWQVVQTPTELNYGEGDPKDNSDLIITAYDSPVVLASGGSDCVAKYYELALATKSQPIRVVHRGEGWVMALRKCNSAKLESFFTVPAIEGTSDMLAIATAIRSSIPAYGGMGVTARYQSSELNGLFQSITDEDLLGVDAVTLHEVDIFFPTKAFSSDWCLGVRIFLKNGGISGIYVYAKSRER